MLVEIRNLTQSEIDEALVKKAVEAVLKAEGAENGEVSIAFLGPGRMRKLNKTFRGKNKVTDVLAFAEEKIPFEGFRIGRPEKVRGLGEIIICPRELKKNEKRFKAGFDQEMARVLIHGVLHLLGYDHEQTEEKAKEMENKEEEYLKQIKE